MEELKPCPFCGVETWSETNAYTKETTIKAAHNKNCYFYGSIRRRFCNKELAVAAWNIRAGAER